MAGLTPTQVANMVLTNLGDQPITALTTDTTDRAEALNRLYATERDAMTIEHPWNCAITRAALVNYTEPATTLTPAATTGTGITFTAGTTGIFFIAGASDIGKTLEGTAAAGEATIATHPKTNPAATLTPASGALTEGTTGVIFTAGSSVFVAGDVGKVITNDTGDGIATITAQGGTTATCTINEAFPSVSAIASASWSLYSTSTVTADITEDFPSTSAIASGDWQLVLAAPAWGFGKTIAVPADCLRMWRVEDSFPYQREGNVFVTDEGTLNVLYIRQMTDPDDWSPHFLQALIHRLTWKMAYVIGGKESLAKLHFQLYGEVLKKAKAYDGQEGTPEVLRSDELTAVRYLGGSRRDNTRTWF